MVHVAHVLSYLDPRFGGPPMVSRHLGRELSQRGFTISCWGSGDRELRSELARQGIIPRIFQAAWPHRWFRSPGLQAALEAENLKHGQIWRRAHIRQHLTP